MMSNTMHGCTSCHYPGCTRWTCPICYPLEHNHDYPRRTEYVNQELRFITNKICLFGHMFEEIGSHFVCKSCGFNVPINNDKEVQK